MRTKVTKKWLESQEPCEDGLAYWVAQKNPDLFEFTRHCIKDNRCEWANWLMVKCMDRKQCMRYVLYAVKQVEPLYRKQYPDSDIVTTTIKAVKACIRDDSVENRAVAAAASATAFNAYTTTTAAADAAAAIAAADAAAAIAAASTAYASAASYAAAYAAADAYNSHGYKEAYKDMLIKILRYGIRIMKEKQKCELLIT